MMTECENWTIVELIFLECQDTWILFKDVLRPWMDGTIGPIQQEWRIESVKTDGRRNSSHFVFSIKEAKYATMLKMRFSGAI